MSPFDPFRGGGFAQRGQCPLFLPFFFLEGFPKPRSIKMFLCPQAPNFSKKCPPKRRVIATKLNLQQKCVNHFFHHFSLFFLVFHGFSSFLFVFCRFSSIQIYSHSKLKQVLQTSVQFSLQHKILYVQPPFPTFWLWKTLPFQLLLISKYCNCK